MWAWCLFILAVSGQSLDQLTHNLGVQQVVHWSNPALEPIIDSTEAIVVEPLVLNSWAGQELFDQLDDLANQCKYVILNEESRLTESLNDYPSSWTQIGPFLVIDGNLPKSN